MGFFIYSPDHSGYGWSDEAVIEIHRRKGMSPSEYDNYDESLRDDPVAHQLMDEWGSNRCGEGGELVKTFVPDELMSYVSLDEYDGAESVKIDTTQMYEDMMNDVLSLHNVTLHDVKERHKEIKRRQQLASIWSSKEKDEESFEIKRQEMIDQNRATEYSGDRKSVV